MAWKRNWENNAQNLLYPSSLTNLSEQLFDKLSVTAFFHVDVILFSYCCHAELVEEFRSIVYLLIINSVSMIILRQAQDDITLDFEILLNAFSLVIFMLLSL
jgi:hypothetical protein